MASPPAWAQHNAARTFAMVAFEPESIAQRAAAKFQYGITARRFRRAALAIQDRKIIERRSEMLVGWKRILIAEDGMPGADSSLGLTGFAPRWQPEWYGFEPRPLNIVLHKHALARLYERDIQPLDGVAADLLSPHFINCFSQARLDQADYGFAIPFRSGRLVGSPEYFGDVYGEYYSTFHVRSWLPTPLENFTWTAKPSRTLLRALEAGRKRDVMDLLGRQGGLAPNLAKKV